MSRIASLVAILTLAMCPLMALAQPSITRAIPRAVAPAKTTEITFSGDKLTRPLYVWTSFPAKVDVRATDADNKNVKQLVCKITLAADVPVGLGGIVVGNSGGVSKLFVLPIDDMASVTDNGKNRTQETAQLVTLPVAVDGVSDGKNFDHYAFEGKQGQRFSADAYAARIGSSFDPVMRLFDPNGRQLAIADDAESLGADCRISLVLPATGRYRLLIHDNKYAAGGQYRLRMGDFPVIHSAYPLGGRYNSTSEFRFLGDAPKAITTRLLRMPAKSFAQRINFGVRYPNSTVSGIATLSASWLPEATERETNNEAKQATKVTFPCAINGAFQQPSDVDYFCFPATKGQRVSFQAASTSLGSTAFCQMRLLDSAGKQLAASAVGVVAETNVTATIPNDGMYYLAVSEMFSRGGPAYGYRIEMTSGGSFQLRMKNEKNAKVATNLANVSAWPINLEIVRNGYDGPINLAANTVGYPTSALPSITLIPNVIPAKAKTARVLVVVPPTALSSDVLQTFRLVGSASVADHRLESFVSTASWLKTQFPTMVQSPDWYDGVFHVTRGGTAKAIFKVSVPQQRVMAVSSAGSVTFPVTVAPIDKNFKSDAQISIGNLPTGFVATAKRDKGKPTYQITVTYPTTISSTQIPLSLDVLGDIKGVFYRQQATVDLSVVNPLSLQIGSLAPVLPGKTVPATIRLRRPVSNTTAPLSFRWKSLPSGVTCQGYTIAAGPHADEMLLTATLVLAPKTAPGNHTIQFEVKSAYQKQPTSAVATATLSISKPPKPKPAPAKKKK